MLIRTQLSIGAVTACLVATGVAAGGPVPVVSTSRVATPTVKPSPTIGAPTSKPTSTTVTCAVPKRPPVSLRDAARQVVFTGFTNETDERLRTLARNGLGGFVSMNTDRTVESVDKTRARIAVVRAAATEAGVLPPFISVDEEGGRVQRLPALGRTPSARSLGELGDGDVQQAGSRTGHKLAQLGFNMDFAPVADVDGRASGVIADRSFSADATIASQRATAFAAGLRSAGVTPVFKHFPGHGHANGDSHKLLPSTPPLRELEQRDLVPFKVAIEKGASVIMLGHLVVPGLTEPNTPTTFSPNTYSLARSMGFTGLLITDDLGMGALAAFGTVPNRATLAIDAGATMVLVTTTAGVESVIDAIEARMKSDARFKSKVDSAVRTIRGLKMGC